MQFLSNDVSDKVAIKLGDLSITYALLEQKIGPQSSFRQRVIFTKPF
jgi:hypothetical protein